MALSLSNATVSAGGTTVDLTFTGGTGFAPLTPTTGVSGFTVTAGGDANVVLNAYRSASTVITLVLTTPVYASQAVLIAATGSNLTDALSESLPNFSGFAATNNSTQINPSAGTTWYYASQADVSDAISVAGLRIASNMENTTDTTNTARILRAGTFADALMDGKLSAMGFATPISLANANDAEILKQISIYIVLVQLGRWRVLQTPSGDSNSMRNVLQKLGDEWMKAASDLLASIDNRNIVLSATRSILAPSDNSNALDIRGVPLYSQYSPLGIWGFALPPFV